MSYTEALQYKTPHYNARSATRYIVVHHAADTYPRGEALQRIYNYHKDQWPGYAGIGYHIVIQEELDASLASYLVNPQEQIAAHTLNHNHHAFGICAATDFSYTPPLGAWWNTLVKQVAYWSKVYPNAAIVGHKELRDTRCPGDWWLTQKNVFLNDVRQALADPFQLWRDAGFGLTPQQEMWAIPQYWLQNQDLGSPTSHEIYLNSFQSFQGFQQGSLYYSSRTGSVTRL